MTLYLVVTWFPFVFGYLRQSSQIVHPVYRPPSYESTEQRARFIARVDKVRRETLRGFSNMRAQSDTAFELLLASPHSNHYSLACISNAADYNGWMTNFAEYLVERAIQTVQAPPGLETVYIENEELSSALFGTPDDGFYTFHRIVAVLEWRSHPSWIRDLLQDLYIKLLESYESHLYGIHIAVRLFRGIIDFLSPSPELHRPYAEVVVVMNELRQTIDLPG